MAKMMKAAVVTKFKEPLEIKDVEIPKPKANDVLVKMIVCGVCHTDLHAAHGDWDNQPQLPRIPGHEGIGEIVELGTHVDANHLKVGDIIGIPWLHSACLHCEYCYTSRETLCKEQINSGYGIDGCFAEYALMDADFAIKLPEGLDPVISAPLYCAGVTTYKALKTSNVRPVYDGPADKHGSWIQEQIGGVQASVVTAVVPVTFDQAFKSVKRGGRVVAVGLPKGNMSVPIVDTVLQGIELVGSIVGTRQDLQEALDLAKSNNITCKVQTKKLEDINQIFDDMIHNKISGRIVIDFRK
ncbi:unnamed protein product [Didymodactylos carnosus]|uniref:Alcohol dehydrogenase n=1 Tax=Didymodactylos carnosus TaxID=1234261 RepID=A0A814NK08_9BILA|nr:unnamed protein product [Didymodactylos carnosus]CAF1093150.1 unnamed protein product [Didymodactylos carnosus]CAF3769676.1 unnamed protein product [Didymodactylos carnosus]CAF3858522.1 unnamed protein product [Didymodactylos carnosus]